MSADAPSATSGVAASTLQARGGTLSTTEAQPTPRTRRTFGRLVDDPVLEDYSLRYAPSTFRRWSEFTVASAALGGIAYLADFAIGGSIAITYGLTNALVAILLAAVVIFLTSIPIAYYSAKYSIDMDLLTRGAGFGYLGSTITSLIYASFTFSFFSLEGSIMAQAFNRGIPLWLAYLIGALIIIPLVTFGMTLLSKLQVWTQPIWLILMFSPFVALAFKDPSAYASWTHFKGTGSTSGLNPISMGLGAGSPSRSSRRSASRSTTCASCPPRRPPTPAAGGPRSAPPAPGG